MPEAERQYSESGTQVKSVEAGEMSDDLYNLCEKCIIKWYPEGRGREIASEVLDDFDVVVVTEQKGAKKIIVGLATYQLVKDNRNIPYVLLGVAVVDPERREEGYAKQLLEKIKNIGELGGCQYMTARADTEYGKNFLEASGFYLTKDVVTGEEYYHLDLD